MDWTQILLKGFVAGLVAAAAKVSAVGNIVDLQTLWTLLAAGFIMGVVNFINQLLEPQTVAASKAAMPAPTFWSKVRKAL